MKRLLSTAAGILACLSLAGAEKALKPADLDAEGLLRFMEAQSARYQNVRFDLTQTISARGQTAVFEGEGMLKPPRQSRFSFRMASPMGEVATSLIEDGRTRWQVTQTPRGLSVIRFDLDGKDSGAVSGSGGFDMMNPIWMMGAGQVREARVQMLQDFDLQVKGVDETAETLVYVASLIPRQVEPGGLAQARGVSRVEMCVGREDGFLRAMDIYDPAGNLFVHKTVRNFRFNEEMPDSLFSYTPPPGVSVGDGNALVEKQKEARRKQEEARVRQAAMLQKEAPDFTLRAFDGQEMSLKALRGKVVLVDFWASWCGPCVRALPHIQKIHEDFRDKGLVVLGINTESPEVAQKFVQEKGYTFPMLIDEGRRVSLLYQVISIPTTVIIDREGKVQSLTVGLRPEGEVRQALAQAGIH